MEKHLNLTCWFILISLIIVMVGCTKDDFSNQNIDKKNISTELKEQSIDNNNIVTNEQKEKLKIWVSTLSDVNGNSIKEKLELVGLSKDEVSNEYCSGKVTLIIKNSVTGEVLKSQQIFEDSVYTPNLKIADLNHDSVNDILVKMDSRGNGYEIYYTLYSFVKNELKEISLSDIGVYDKHIQ